MSNRVIEAGLFFFLFSFLLILRIQADEFGDENVKNQTDDTCMQTSSCETTNREENSTEFAAGTSVNILSRNDEFTDLWDTPTHVCPVDKKCHELPADCLVCTFNLTCVYGEFLNVSCHAVPKCEGPKIFLKAMKCQYCYQTSPEDHSCTLIGYCNTAANPVQKYRSNCTAKPDVLCLGQRKFIKNIRCNWTSGYKWSTTLLLSVTLGGFGADRFYLGHWQEGIGKLFSFGGAGVWTLVDVILVAVGYLKPADGSVYI